MAHQYLIHASCIQCVPLDDFVTIKIMLIAQFQSNKHNFLFIECNLSCSTRERSHFHRKRQFTRSLNEISKNKLFIKQDQMIHLLVTTKLTLINYN